MDEKEVYLGMAQQNRASYICVCCDVISSIVDVSLRVSVCMGTSARVGHTEEGKKSFVLHPTSRITA